MSFLNEPFPSSWYASIRNLPCSSAWVSTSSPNKRDRRSWAANTLDRNRETLCTMLRSEAREAHCSHFFVSEEADLLHCWCRITHEWALRLATYSCPNWPGARLGTNPNYRWCAPAYHHLQEFATLHKPQAKQAWVAAQPSHWKKQCIQQLHDVFSHLHVGCNEKGS